LNLATGTTITATAPGKVILFGEHAVNRGQPAIAASVGLWARCSVSESDRFEFISALQSHHCEGEDILKLGETIDRARAEADFESIRRLAAKDYFAPQKYMLASAFGAALPRGLRLEWRSEVPSCSGLGSGGSAFTAMAAALAELETRNSKLETSLAQRADWAYRGDIVAHGGVASALDTQASLFGGVIRFIGEGLAEPLPCAPGLALVIGHTGSSAPTREVNDRVRRWLAEKPSVRLSYFQSIGALSRAAVALLEHGDWNELGRLLNLNQLVLEKIGVSCPAIDRLIEAALGAGAWGAKISGSGGGGVIIALVSPEQKSAVADAITAAGGTAITPGVAVPGVTLNSEP
jgi:mevalonate kinase